MMPKPDFKTTRHWSKAIVPLGVIFFCLCFGGWFYALLSGGSEASQGAVYRILYVHVPAAITAFLCTLLLFIFSVYNLLRPQGRGMVSGARASAEIALLFTLLTLVTGSIWGRPTWGTWWTWDGRLTTTFILALLLAGYLLLWNSFDDERLRRRACSILGILIFVDVPIIYKSVTWWRTLHQPPSLLSEQGPMMSAPILQLLVFCIVSMIFLGCWLVWLRSVNLEALAEIDQRAYARLEQTTTTPSSSLLHKAEQT